MGLLYRTNISFGSVAFEHILQEDYFYTSPPQKEKRQWLFSSVKYGKKVTIFKPFISVAIQQRASSLFEYNFEEKTFHKMKFSVKFDGNFFNENSAHLSAFCCFLLQLCKLLFYTSYNSFCLHTHIASINRLNNKHDP